MPDESVAKTEIPARDPFGLDLSEEPVGATLRDVAGARSSATTPARRGPGAPGDGRIRSGKLAGLTMNRAIFVLSWPILIDSLLNSFVGLTDTVLAAALPNGEAATDAIGGASYIMWFVGLVLMAIDVGVTALISRAVGAGRLAAANAAVGQAMLLAVVSGVLVGALVVAAAGPLAALMNLNPAATTSFMVYMLYLGLGAPFSAILFAGIACARGAGDSARPLGAMAIVNLVNVLVSWSLTGADLKWTSLVNGEPVTRVILANPFDINMGVAGIALGTIIANAMGAAFMVLMLARGVAGVRLRRNRLRAHPLTMARLIRVGLPNFFETLGMWFGNFLIVLMVGWMTVRDAGGLLGAHIVAIRIEAFSFLPGFAMGAAAATLAGQFLGAGSPAMARRAIWRCTLVTLVMMGIGGAAFIVAPGPIVGLMTSQPTHLALAPKLIFIAGLVQIPFGLSIVLRSALRGAGDVKAVMYLTWTTTYAVRLPLAYLFSGVDIPLPAGLGGGVLENPSPFDGGLPGLWVGLCAEILFRAVLFTARFYQAGWTKARV